MMYTPGITEYTVMLCCATGTEGPQLFALAEPDGIPVPEADLDPDQHKKENKSKKIKNERPSLWKTMLLLTLQRQYFVKNFYVEKLRYILSASGPEPEPNLSQVGTGTAINHYYSTALEKCHVLP